ncbi:Coenzyme F420 hydrogenase/dehydrogenase, beta subunit C-terminal domain [Clostridium vincentii]|uniref:F420H2 dehydrogenase subunit F n=1 Tax=Clostridium vincentii TaxID=52704 RepID=A0A2T0BJM2_9CLOT|nr:Coenzyme F420 hydrogenase/dehydrogenase, beta subunit C-terminal domain [Clostridium vincentii]PRR84095.1 F420H2 dehydrogenase subunit F [Clostridium vincentii]
MIDTIKKELCTGCNACSNICPQNCIEMKDDKFGFRYPTVEYDKCIKCQLCIKTCPSLNKVSLNGKWTIPKIFAAWSLDEEIRFNSTSGGVFSELAKQIINNTGIVVAVRYNEKNLVEHCMIETEDEIKIIRQSKYIQSDIGFIYKVIKTKLLEEKLVGFCGSPCQVAGLLNFLGKPFDNLITFDFVCRGTNSPEAYLKYIDMLEKQYESKVKKVWFKNKTYGWNRFSTRIDFENGKTYIKDRYTDLFMRGYIEENLYMRPCCFDCKYKSFPRVSDLTLADFWGVRAIDPVLDPDKGTSLIMINSEKGNKIFNSIRKNILYRESTLEAAFSGNGCIAKSAIKNLKSDIFLEMLHTYSFDVCFKKCVKSNILKRIKRKFYMTASKVKRTLISFKK